MAGPRGAIEQLCLFLIDVYLYICGTLSDEHAGLRPLALDIGHAHPLLRRKRRTAIVGRPTEPADNDILIQGKRLRLWSNLRKSREDRARNHKLIKMAEAQAARNEGHRTETTGTSIDTQALIKWHDSWYDRSLYSQAEPWVNNEVIARLEDLEL